MPPPGDPTARRYRYKWFPRSMMFVAALNRLLWLGVLVALLGLLAVYVRDFVGQQELPLSVVLLLGPTLIVPVAVAAILLYGLVARAGGALRSYVAVTSEGLEVRRWPVYRIFCRWENVERVGEALTWGYHLLHLRDAQRLDDDALAMVMRRWANRVRRVRPADVLFLRSVRGYPEGDFADDLRRYAPHLFDAEAGADTLT